MLRTWRSAGTGVFPGVDSLLRAEQQDCFDLSLAQRDLQSIIQMGLFDPLATKLFIEDGPRGGKIIIFQVKEYPIIRDIQYRGLKSATESEILTRFKERRVQVSKESQFDPAKTNGARLVLRELLAEKAIPTQRLRSRLKTSRQPRSRSYLENRKALGFASRI
ncbi:MAG: hypothetical protein IPJ07_10950 [Acidobacteria bacterium]|nr:hypothetical protein [Acidobacteriota bacterium]